MAVVEDGGYDKLARWYRLIEMIAMGNRLQRGRTALLDAMIPPSSMLVLGDGDGRFLAAAAQRFIQCRFTSIDRSGAMIAAQRRRLAKLNAADRVQWIQIDARDYQPPVACFDAAAMVCFLDCFTAADLRRDLPIWLAGVKPSGQVVIVDFTVSGSPRITAAVLRWAMHRFFRLATDLPNRRLVLDAVLPSPAAGVVTAGDRLIGLTATLWPATFLGQALASKSASIGAHDFPPNHWSNACRSRS